MKWNALETDSISLRIHLSIRQGVYKQIEFLNVWFILINKMNLFNTYIMDDELGPKLQDLDLPVRKRIRKEK